MPRPSTTWLTVPARRSSHIPPVMRLLGYVCRRAAATIASTLRSLSSAVPVLERWSYRGEMAEMRMPAFRGRVRERQALDHLLESVRGGESAVLVLRGEAGIGKTALLRYCARQAAGCRVTQIAGVESELELPLAALHQLCAPMLGELPALPEPQQDALRLAFGMAEGKRPGSVRGWAGRAGFAGRGGRPSGRWCAWSTTPSGSTTPPPRSWASSHGACWPSPSRCSSRSGRRRDERLFPGLPALTLAGTHRRGRPGVAHRRRARSPGRAGS